MLNSSLDYYYAQYPLLLQDQQNFLTISQRREGQEKREEIKPRERTMHLDNVYVCVNRASYILCRLTL